MEKARVSAARATSQCVSEYSFKRGPREKKCQLLGGNEGAEERLTDILARVSVPGKRTSVRPGNDAGLHRLPSHRPAPSERGGGRWVLGTKP